MMQTDLIPSALRFAGACLVLLLLSHLAGQYLIEALLPTYRWTIGLIDDHYRILYLGLASQGADAVIRLDVTLQRPLIVGGHLVMPDPRGHAHVTTLSGHALQPLVVFAAGLAAWCARTRREWMLRFACGLPLGWLLAAVDVPSVLTGELWALLADRYSPGVPYPLLLWKDFLQGGGRLALACAVAVTTIIVSQAIAARLTGHSDYIRGRLA